MTHPQSSLSVVSGALVPKKIQWQKVCKGCHQKFFRPSTTIVINYFTRVMTTSKFIFFFHPRIVTTSKLTIFFHPRIVTTSKLTFFFHPRIVTTSKLTFFFHPRVVTISKLTSFGKRINMAHPQSPLNVVSGVLVPKSFQWQKV